jgi:hypothetical protein
VSRRSAAGAAKMNPKAPSGVAEDTQRQARRSWPQPASTLVTGLGGSQRVTANGLAIRRGCLYFLDASRRFASLSSVMTSPSPCGPWRAERAPSCARCRPE